MQPDADYRDHSFLYPLRSHPDYWFHVGKSANKQAILGLLGKILRVVVFSDQGDFLETQERTLVLPELHFLGPEKLDSVHRLVEMEVAQIRKEQGLNDEPIHVKRFHLPKLQVGIQDLPDDLREYIVNRASTGGMEPDLEEALVGWKEESLFVFWWGQSFSVDSKGVVASS